MTSATNSVAVSIFLFKYSIKHMMSTIKIFFFSKLELCCLFRLKQSKELDAEKAFANEQLTRAILRERISNEEERAKAKHLVSMEDLVGRSCLQGNR